MADTEGAVMATAPRVPGLTGYEQDALNRLFDVWCKKLTRNKLKMKYYRKKNGLKDLGISIPPQLKGLDAVIGWPAKAVDMLSARSIFDGFVYEDDVPHSIDGILRDNKFKTMYSQAVNSELIHSCAFITVSKGAQGEPPVLVSFYSAENGAAIWDSRLKRIECGFTIVDVDDTTKQPTWINLYTDEAVIELRSGGGSWSATRLKHAQGRPLMEALTYCPDLDRPMGKSRISRAVMSITDSAVRTIVRSELSAEFFTSPQKYFLGVDDELFADRSKWETYIGTILALTRDEEGNVPQVGQFPQMSMQPHTDYMRNLAAQFAGETNLPISCLGVIHDNPASAEAMRTAESYLIMEAEALNETNGDALRNIGLLVHAISQNKTIDQLTDEEKSIEPRFRDPSMPSVVSQSDAIVKQVSALPWLAETDVVLEMLGYNKEQRTRMMKSKRETMARAALEQARQQAAERMASGEEGQQRTMYMVQSIISNYRRGTINRKNAELLFGQIGIDQNEAASILDDSEDMEDVTQDMAKGGGENA